MPSHDDYLDELLGNLTDNLDEGKDSPLVNSDLNDMDMSDIEKLLQSAEAAHEEFGASDTDSLIAELEQAEKASESIGLDEMTNMSEEDIIKLLEAGQQEPENQTSTSDDMDDLMSLLNATEDSDLQEIQSLLEKADNNEPVADIAGAAEPEMPQLSNEQSKQDEKKAKQEAKRAAKEAAKEAKNAAKDAKRSQKEASRQEAAARKAEKKATKASKAKTASTDGSETMNGEVREEAVTDEQKLLEEEIVSMDFFKQISVDDSILQATGSASEDSLAQIMDKDDNRRKKNQKGKKSKSDNTEKKKGAFSKFIDFLNEEESEEEDAIQLSDENKKILKEMDKEKKKKKKKNAKKGQAVETGEDGENGEVKAKKGKKPKREKKPKKEKAPRPESEEIPEKKLSGKKVAAIVLVCISLGLVVVICSNYVGDYAAKNNAKEAYYAGDYQACFQNLYGKDLNESEQVMYSKSESILTIRLWLSEYELLAKEGLELEALDSLIQAVYDYPTLYGYSVQWNAGSEVGAIYAQILEILADKYHLSEMQVLEIANIPDDVEYTRAVMAVVAGDFSSSVSTMPSDKEEFPNKLPEETELGDAALVDNNVGLQ